MGIIEQFSDIKVDQGVENPIILPVEGVTESNWEFKVYADGTTGWRDMTGKHTVTVVGTPALITGQPGFVGTKDNYLSVDFQEERDWLDNQDFVAVTVGRFFQDAAYASCHFMGSLSGTSPTDYRGWSMGMNYNTPTSECRNWMNLSLVRSGTEYRQGLFYNHPLPLADVARYRLQIMRVRHTARTYEVFSFDGYDGTSALDVATYTFNVSDALTGRLQANTDIHLGSYNGYTGQDQCHFVYGALYKGDLNDTQIRAISNGLRDQFRSTKDIGGVATLGGLTALRGMTPFDLYAPALT